MDFVKNDTFIFKHFFSVLKKHVKETAYVTNVTEHRPQSVPSNCAVSFVPRREQKFRFHLVSRWVLLCQ